MRTSALNFCIYTPKTKYLPPNHHQHKSTPKSHATLKLGDHMSTPAQIHANQHNATRSTGPRTAPGKATSAANSTRHGFRSQTVLLPGDDPAE